ncbi:MAG: CBS domain-containing protein [Rhodoferax sp.]|nr:CBS domain-containing protein [Rhodoferax sp.]
MFSVYGKAGRLFRGSMEELRKIGPTSALARTQRVAGVGRGATDDFVAQLALAGQGGHAAPARPDAAHRDAMAAYAQAAASQPPRHPLKLVQDIMNPGAICVGLEDNVGQAWGVLAQHQLGQAPVVDANGVLVGLLTRAELMRSDRLPGPHAHALVWQALLVQSVADLMWTPVPSVAPATDIRRLARVLLDTGLPGLPVVDDAGKVQAFVSRTDILRAVVADPPLDLWS